MLRMIVAIWASGIVLFCALLVLARLLEFLFPRLARRRMRQNRARQRFQNRLYLRPSRPMRPHRNGSRSRSLRGER